MFKEILQLIPKISGGDLNNMERSLSSRFGRVAKKFGKGLVGVIGGGGVMGATLGLIDKFLNPLQATQEAIDKQIAKANDISTSAKQFDSTAGKLFKLQQMAAGKGLDAQSLDLLLVKYQSAISEANADPTKPSAVRQFAGDKDIVDSFYQFIQSLGKITDKNKQVAIQKEVFGEKQTLKMSEFLNTSDWFALQRRTIGAHSGGELTNAIEKQGELKNLQDELQAKRDTADMLAKGERITAEMIKADSRRKAIATNRENQDIANYQNLQKMAIAIDELMNMGRQLVVAVGQVVTTTFKLDENLSAMAKSSIFKGLLKVIKADW